MSCSAPHLAGEGSAQNVPQKQGSRVSRRGQRLQQQQQLQAEDALLRDAQEPQEMQEPVQEQAPKMQRLRRGEAHGLGR